MAQELVLTVALDYDIERATYSVPQSVRRINDKSPPDDPMKATRLHVALKDNRISSHRVDAWRLRENFLSLKTGNVPDLVAFLNQTGLWDETQRPYWTDPRTGEVWEGTMAKIQPIWNEQEALKRLLLLGPQAWFGEKKKTLSFESRSKSPHFIQVDRFVITAIYTTVSVDFLRGFRFAACLREDCAKPFRLDHKAKRYCTQYCAHLVSLRKSRSKAKKEKQRASRIATKVATRRKHVNF